MLGTTIARLSPTSGFNPFTLLLFSITLQHIWAGYYSSASGTKDQPYQEPMNSHSPHIISWLSRISLQGCWLMLMVLHGRSGEGASGRMGGAGDGERWNRHVVSRCGDGIRLLMVKALGSGSWASTDIHV